MKTGNSTENITIMIFIHKFKKIADATRKRRITSYYIWTPPKNVLQQTHKKNLQLTTGARNGQYMN